MPSPSAPQLGWYTDTNLNPPTTTATTLSPNHFCCPPSTYFSSAFSPLESLPPSSRGSAPLYPRSPPTKPLSPHLPSAQLATPSPIPSCLTLSATLLRLLLFVFLTLNLLTFQVTTNSNAINPKTPTPAPTPNRSPLLSPLLLLSLLASFLLLLPSPLLLTPLLPGLGWGWIPTKLSATSTPLCLSPTTPLQAPDQPQRDAPHVGPRRAPAFVWFRVGSRAATPFPHRSDGGLLERLVLRRDPGSSAVGDVLFAATGVEGSIFRPPAYPPAPRGGEMSHRDKLLQILFKTFPPQRTPY